MAEREFNSLRQQYNTVDVTKESESYFHPKYRPKKQLELN